MFEECKEINECKMLFRQLAKLLHPDKGGSHELMIRLKISYENAIEKLGNGKESSEDPKNNSKHTHSDKVMAGDPRLKILDMMADMVEEHPYLNGDFYFKIEVFFMKNGYLSVKQLTALENWKKIWECQIKENGE